jgi:hypothetical protein
MLPSCKDVARLLSESMDTGRPLGAHTRLHMRLCKVCRLLAEQFKLLRKAAGRTEDACPGLSDEAKSRLKNLLG